MIIPFDGKHPRIGREAYVSRVFKLTKVSPVILERAIAGKMTMEALMAMDGCWVQQEGDQNRTYSGMVL